MKIHDYHASIAYGGKMIGFLPKSTVDDGTRVLWRWWWWW